MWLVNFEETTDVVLQIKAKPAGWLIQGAPIYVNIESRCHCFLTQVVDCLLRGRVRRSGEQRATEPSAQGAVLWTASHVTSLLMFGGVQMVLRL